MDRYHRELTARSFTVTIPNGWQLAKHAREARPDGMQRLLSQAVWDTNGVRYSIPAALVRILVLPLIAPLYNIKRYRVAETTLYNVTHSASTVFTYTRLKPQAQVQATN